LQVLAETVEDLVDASPAASMVDGSVILGSKDTTLLVLDASTGELIEEMAALGGRIMQIADLVGELAIEKPCHSSRRRQTLANGCLASTQMATGEILQGCETAIRRAQLFCWHGATTMYTPLVEAALSGGWHTGGASKCCFLLLCIWLWQMQTAS
jgi:hypothetical protein